MNASRKLKAVAAGVGAAVLAAAVLAGCAARLGMTPETPATAPEPPQGLPVSMLMSDHSQPVPQGDVMEDPTFRYLAEKTGTVLSIEFLPHHKYNVQMRNKLFGGHLPDVVQDWRINPDLYAGGKLLALNDLIDRYGPHLKRAIPQEAWDAVTINGNIYGIPEAANGNAPSSRVIYVRKDWMDKAGVRKVPETPDEFLDMLRAFRDNDPNGNGRRDEIPFSSRADFNWSENLMGMFGVTPSGNHLLDGVVIPDIIHPRMKQALAFFRVMFEEGLIDEDFLIQQRNAWEQKIQSDLVGSWNHTTDLAWDWQDRLNRSLPGRGAEVIAIPTPRAPGVEAVGMEMNAVKKVFNVTANAKHPEAIVGMFDWLVTEEGQEFVNFGVPGVTWTKAGGSIRYDRVADTENRAAVWRMMLLNLVGYNKELLTVRLGPEAAGKLDAAYAIARKEGIPNPVAGMPALKSEMRHPDLSRYGPVFVRSAAQIVLDHQPVDYFDEFVAEWRAQGGEAIVREMTEWYLTNRKP